MKCVPYTSIVSFAHLPLRGRVCKLTNKRMCIKS